MFKNYIFSVIFLSVFATHSPANAEFYKWTDENGNVHYGDKPVSGKNNKSVNIYESGRTTSTPTSESGNSTKNRATPTSRADARRKAIANTLGKADQRIRDKVTSDNAMHQKKLDDDIRRNELSNKYAIESRKLEMETRGEKLKIGRETQEKLDNTLSLCQRFPNNPRCNQHQVGYRDGAINRSVNVTPGHYRPLSKRQKEEQRKIKSEQQKKLNKIDREHNKKSMKELRKSFE